LNFSIVVNKKVFNVTYYSENDIKQMIEKDVRPSQEGYQPVLPTLVNPNKPNVKGGYQPIVNERQAPKLPPTKK
jgi:hypothetical protein